MEAIHSLGVFPFIIDPHNHLFDYPNKTHWYHSVNHVEFSDLNEDIDWWVMIHTTYFQHKLAYIEFIDTTYRSHAQLLVYYNHHVIYDSDMLKPLECVYFPILCSDNSYGKWCVLQLSNMAGVVSPEYGLKTNNNKSLYIHLVWGIKDDSLNLLKNISDVIPNGDNWSVKAIYDNAKNDEYEMYHIAVYHPEKGIVFDNTVQMGEKGVMTVDTPNNIENFYGFLKIK